MPLPKAKRSASKKRKQQVMRECMSETKGTGRKLSQRQAMCLKAAGLSKKKRKRRGRKK